jgi:site-specific recombinase XerD
MDQYFRYEAVRQRLRVGPLSDSFDSFARKLSEYGYAIDSGQQQLRAVARLSRWMSRRRLRAKDLDEQVAAEFLRQRRRRGRMRNIEPKALALLLEHLRQDGVVARPAPCVPEDGLGLLQRDFERYLLHERGLAEATVSNYLGASRAFLSTHLNNGTVDPRQLSLADVIGFVRRIAQSRPPRSAKFTISGLRAFLRFLYVQGRTATDLAASVPTVPHWKVEALPRSLNAHEVESLLHSCDRTTMVGKRDYAVLCLLARLGLRAGEVAAMTLDDIDWRAGELTVRGKGGTRERLPLLAEVGQALAAYLREARPSCATRHVLVTARAPFREFAGPTTVCRLVEQAIKRAGLKTPRRGAHLLRHSLATTLLQRGASLQEIGDVLRHRHPATTQIYAKVDVAALQALAQPWPEEGS